jgi:hypothetical protein
MPVEIKELVVRAVVPAEDQDPGAASGTATLSEEEKTAMVEACVREVLKVLRSSKER